MKQIFNVMDSPGGVRALVSAMASQDGLRVKPQVHESKVYQNPQEYSQDERRAILLAWNHAGQAVNGDVSRDFMEVFRNILRIQPDGISLEAMLADPAFFYGEI